jgi:predicted amidohydrolase
MLNSLNSFALDEAALHIPVRAVENGVFVVAANKVGPLLPADQVKTFSEALGIPPDALNGAGESQIIAPDGEVLAVAGRTDEELIVADIDLSIIASVEDRFGRRRPELYEPVAKPDSATPRSDVPDAVAVRCVPGAADVEVVARAFDGDARLVVLPEGTPVPMVVPDDTWLVTSTFIDGAHFGQVWSADGLVHEQLQLHRTDRLPEVTELGDRLDVIKTPWGDLAVIVGDDHLYPETLRLAAIQGAHVAVVLYAPTEPWQIDLAIRERAAENRLCLVACAPQGTAGTMVLNPPRDSLWSTDRSQPYDGTINTPDAVVADPDNMFFDAMIHPSRALRREISRDTDLVGGRPWQASAELL